MNTDEKRRPGLQHSESEKIYVELHLEFQMLVDYFKRVTY